MAYNKKAVLEGNTEAIRVILRLEKERREPPEPRKSCSEVIKVSVV